MANHPNDGEDIIDPNLINPEVQFEFPEPISEMIITPGLGMNIQGSGNEWTISLEDRIVEAIAAAEEAATVEDNDYWNISVVPDSSPAEFTLTLNGAAIQPAGSVALADSYVIADVGNAHTPVDGSILYLEAERNGTGDVDITLIYGPVWADIPSSYNIGSSPIDHMEKYYYPLYQTFLLADSPTGKVFTIGAFKLKKLVPNNSLQINNVVWRRSTGPDALMVVDFTPPAEPFV